MEAMRIAVIGLAVLASASAAAAQTQYESPVWSPDGAIAFVAKPAGGEWNVFRAAADGSHRVQLTQQGAWDPAWSPDGKAIAFVSTIDGKRQISLLSPDGTGMRQITRGAAEHFHPAWSRDGRRIACVSAENGTGRIVAMNADGSNVEPVTPTGERARWPTWSPDGRRIAYYMEASTSGIWVMDVAAATHVKLFDSGLTRTLLDWSPDGKEIVFIRGTGKDLGIDVLNERLGSVRRYLGSELGPGEPRSSPDGKMLLFSTHSPPGIAMLNLSNSTVTAVLN